MCGICGTTSQRDAEAAVRAMNSSMRHRGPDDEGVFVDDRSHVALGARRLSIIDVSGGHQPVSNEDATVWAVLNGEIYNYPSLRSELEHRGHSFRSRVDTEVLVHLYEEYGEQLVHALEGMYALAIWDSTRGRLVLARDRFGEKPLFYAEPSGELIFASELDALRAGDALSDELDPEAVDEYFLLGYVAAPASIVTGARQLPPASLLSWTRAAGSSGPQTYWSLPNPAEDLNGDERSIVPEVRESLVRSVQSRMISDVPLGVFLSGGLDSSLVAALAAGESPHKLKTFSIGYGSGRVNETDAARRVASLIGSEHREHVLHDSDVSRTVLDTLPRLDQPLADQAIVAMYSLAKFARNEVKVVVGGEGADELFGGYGRYRWLNYAQRVPSSVSQTVGRVAVPVLRRIRHRYGDHFADLLARTQLSERNLNWATDGRLGNRSLIYGPRLEAAGASRWLAMPSPGDSSIATALMRLDTKRWLADDVLAKADRASMLASLELRTPYLERELAELAAVIPTRIHLADTGKSILRRVLAEVSPQIKLQRKTAFRVPTSDWLRGPLSTVLDEQLRAGSAYSEGWLAPQAISKLWDQHRAGRRDWSGLLWPALAFGLWLDRFRGRATVGL